MSPGLLYSAKIFSIKNYGKSEGQDNGLDFFKEVSFEGEALLGNPLMARGYFVNTIYLGEEIIKKCLLSGVTGATDGG